MVDLTAVSCNNQNELIQVKVEGWTRFSKGWHGWSKGNPEEQPCQPEENPVHPDGFTWIYIIFKKDILGI